MDFQSVVSSLDNHAGTITGIATLVLAIITAKYVKLTDSMLNEQRKSNRKDRLIKEMDLLVAPLYCKINDSDFFIKGVPGNRGYDHPIVQGYFKFWDGIKQNKYLGSDYLRLALDDYFNSKTEKQNDPPDNAYNLAKEKLYEAIRKRYLELTNELAALE